MPGRNLSASSPELPLSCAGLRGTGGVIKREPADFVVDEVPQYAASGEGQHLFLHVEKEGRTTDDVVAWLAALGFREIGTAGKKDKQARTRQYISVERRLWTETMAAGAPEGIRILSAVPHVNKLKTGHLRGNRFQIVLSGVASTADLPAIVERIKTHGMPNYFGEQRFGRSGNNAEDGLRVLRGAARMPKKKAQFFLSALQSELFNRVLAGRVETGTWRTVLAGDILKKFDSGGLFRTEDPSADQPRLDAGELAPAGPLFGPDMTPAAAQAKELEDAVLAEAGITAEEWASSRVPTTGTRRSLFVFPGDLETEVRGADVHLSFFLPKGSFATVLVREIAQGAPQDVPA